MNYQTILGQLRECHNGQQKKGTMIGNYYFHKIISADLTSDQIAAFLDAYYINAYYYDQDIARKIANYYIFKTRDSDFYTTFLKEQAHIQSNFSHLGIRVPLQTNHPVHSTYPLTLVTGLFNLCKQEPHIKRGKSFDDYLRYGEYIFSIDCPLVVYIEPEHVDYILKRRLSYGLENKTHIVGIQFKDLEYYKKADQIQLCRQINPILNTNPNKETHLYIVTIWSKFHLLQQSLKSNPFGSSHMAWIDFGITHIAHTDHVKEDQLFFNQFEDCWIPDKIKIQYMMSWDPIIDKKHYFSYIRGNICAGYFTGSLQSMNKLCDEFLSIADQCLNEGFAPTEEQLLPLVIDKNPTLFDFYYGDYWDIFNNYKHQRGSIDLNILNIKNSLGRMPHIANDAWHKIFKNYRNGYPFYTENLNQLLDLYPNLTQKATTTHQIVQIKLASVCPIAIGVMSSVVNDKYKGQISACVRTWCKDAKKHNIPVYFFGGYLPFEEDIEIDYININADLMINRNKSPNVNEDMLSAWDKHFYGLKWLYHNTNAKYYMIIGTDTFIHIPNLLKCVYQHDCNNHLYLGGIKPSIHENFIRTLDNVPLKFISGGPGIIHTRPTVKEIIGLFNEIVANWKLICERNNQSYMYQACDVTIAYYMHKLGIKPIYNDLFNPYKHSGEQMDELVSCHYMEPDDMDSYYEYLNK